MMWSFNFHHQMAGCVLPSRVWCIREKMCYLYLNAYSYNNTMLQFLVILTFSNGNYSVTNKARDLWSVTSYKSWLALSLSINLESPNSSKLYITGNQNTPFLGSNCAVSRSGNIWPNDFYINRKSLKGHNFFTNNDRKV